MDLLFCHRGILSTLMVHGRISNALLAATLQMEENRLWSIKMKLDVSTALKSRGEKMLFLGHFVVVNWSEQLAVMQVMELLFSFHLLGLCVCVCQSKREAWLDMGKRRSRRKYNQMMARMKETSSQSHSEGICTGVSCSFKHLRAPFTFSTTSSGSVKVEFL